MSKQRRFVNATVGSSHYYGAPEGEPGNSGDTCLVPQGVGFVQNPDTRDICEDTTIEILIKAANVPETLLQPGKEAEFDQFLGEVDYARKDLGIDYTSFYAVANNRFRLGYIDPDPGDKASRIEIDPTSVRNGTVLGSSCLEGACTVTFRFKRDYNSGHVYGDRDAQGALAPHAEFLYRIRTNEPSSEDGVDAFGTPLSEVGWTKWAKAQIEVTAVDEEPIATGITVAAVEDIVQKIVICEDFNDTDPECAAGKTLTLDPSSATSGLRYLSGRGKGYFDLEADPVVKVLPRTTLDPAKAKWVRPANGVTTPDPTISSHWTDLAGADVTDETKDQTAGHFPFMCDKVARKCVGYLRPAAQANSDNMGVLNVPYDLWVEVDTASNPDPSYVGRSSTDRMRKSVINANISVDFTPVNDSPRIADVLESLWLEDDNPAHEVVVVPDVVSPPALVDSTTGTWWDPDGDRVRDNTDIEVRFLDGTVTKTSYCRGGDETLLRVAADVPGTIVGARCRVKAGTLSYLAQPNMGNLATQAPLYNLPAQTTAELNIEWQCNPTTGCVAKFLYPLNAHGNNVFEYRVRSTRLQGAAKEYRPDDWSDWKQVDVTVNSVPDEPLSTSVSLATIASDQETIKEDIPFVVRLVRANGNGATNKDAADLGPTGAPFGSDQRLYHSYFDVDETDDIAVKIVVSSVSQISGVPVVRKADGSAIAANDDTIFTCDAYGVCEGTLLSAPDLNTRTGGDPFISFKVITAPKATPNDLTNRLTSLESQISFKIIDTDDAPSSGGPGGAGGAEIALAEDANNEVVIRFNGGAGAQLAYSDPDPGDYAEKIEIAEVTVVDPDPVATLSGGYGWYSPPPSQVLRTGDERYGWVLGEWRVTPTDKNTTYVTVPDAETNSSSDRWRAADGTNPERFQYTCRSKLFGTLNQGDCRLIARGPKDFNTRAYSTRAMTFKWRVFSRWQGDPASWDPNDETNGGWTPWSTATLALGAVNDPPIIKPIDNAKLGGSEPTAGVNSASNRVVVNEDEWSSIVFRYQDTYDSVETTTETYTYQNDLTASLCTGAGGENPFFCMLYKIDWLATKIAVAIQRMTTQFWDNSNYPAPGTVGAPNPAEVIASPQLKTQLSSWMAGAWSEGTNGQYWGAPAPTLSAGANSNVNCKPNGECELRFLPPQDFFGKTEFTLNLADGKTAPADADWSTPQTLNVQVKNVDDLPGSLPMVIDVFEDQDASIEFGRVAAHLNKCADGYRLNTTAGADSCQDGTLSMAQDDPNRPLPYQYGRDVGGGVLHGVCQQRISDLCPAPYYARLHSMYDADRETPSDVQLRSETNVTATPRAPIGSTGKAFSLGFPPNFYNTTGANTTGRPYTYAGNAALGNASFEYRVKTKADEQCAGAEDCWSNWSQVHVRVHPVNDGLRLNPGVANIPCTFSSQSGSVNCSQSITVQEEQKFSVTIPRAHYYDPDSAQMPGRDEKYGRAIGISQCFSRSGPTDIYGAVATSHPTSDNKLFVWSPAFSYQTDYEDNFSNGRTDGYVDEGSQLLSINRSKGTLVLNGAVPSIGHGQNGSRPEKHPLASQTSTVATITGLPGITLNTSCPLDGSNWPTGDCTMELMPPPNVYGEFVLCLQLTDPIGPGEFFAANRGDDRYSFGNTSEQIYIKVNIENTPDVPRIAQMPVRGRANEDHEASFEVGGRNPVVLPEFVEKGLGTHLFGGGGFGSLVFSDQAAVVRPGYYDFDGSKAKFMYIDMNAAGGSLTGIKNASIRYNADPALNTYSQVCQSGFPASNICEVPCDTDGWCRYKIVAGTDKGTERITLSYWVKTEEANATGVVLSTRKAENLSASNGNNPNYVPFESDLQYINTNHGCVKTSNWIWDDWRTDFEEDHSQTGIPGLFYSAMHPILTPAYAQLANPPVTRLVPNLMGLGKTNTRRLSFMPPQNAIRWSTDPSPKPGAGNSAEMAETDGPSSIPGESVPCGDMSKGRIVADFMEVPDRPSTQNVTRSLLEDVAGQVLYLGSSASNVAENGYSDGDGDGPTRLVFHSNLPDTVGTLSLSSTPPATPEGMGTGVLTDGSGLKYIPMAPDLVSAGCQTANRRCLFYFHPAANYSGSHTLNFSVVTGSDSWASDPAALGTLQLNVAGTNDAPVITLTDTVPVSLAGGVAPTASTYRFNVSEGGGTDEETQVVSLSATSASPSIVTAQIRNEADTGAWADAGVAASAVALLKLTPQPFASGDVLITVTATDSGGQTTTWTKTVTIDNPNQKPGIVFDTFGAGPYEIDEDTGLVQELRIPSGFRAGQFADVLIDEGSGDTDEQVISVSFASNNILVLPNANISFSRTDTAGANDMGAATGRILLRPVGDLVTSATPVTVTMTVTETNVVPPKSENFVFTVHVKPGNDAPTVAATLTAGSPYAGTEDVNLSMAATLDEGGGDDENAQTLGVSFDGYDTSLVQGVTFSRTDDGATNMGAAAGNIVVVPQPNAHGTTTITLNLDDGVGGTTSQAFTVSFSAVNDAPRLVSGISASASTNEDTPLVLNAVALDEGGAASGSYNEDADVLTFSFTSSNTALVPVGNIALNVATDDATDASAVTRTLTITPVAHQHGSTTVTVRASDGVNSNITLATVALTVSPVADLPAGNVACSPTNSAGLAAGSYLHKAGSSLAGKGITCSGISDADGDTVSYSVSGTCATGGMTIGATTGVVAGTMPATACSLVVSATAGGDEIAGGQQQTLSFAPGEVATATLTVPTLGANTTCAVSATPAATYSGGAVFASALASATTAGMGSFSASATTWSGVLEDFQPAGYTLRWAVTSNSGDTMNADLNVTLGKTALPLQSAAPAATLFAAPAAGHQPSFTYPSNQCSSQSQCSSQPRAALAAGFDHSCAVASNGGVSCWGNNAPNKLGVASGASYAKAQVLSGLSNVRAVTAGRDHSCAVTSAGALSCWGDNTYGQLGTENNTAATTATAVPLLTSGVASVAAGAHHTCALLTDGSVKCFGRNDKGQLGDSSLVNRNAPVTPIAAHAKVLTASGGHTCAFTDDGTTRDVKCWGDNTTDQLGVGMATPSASAPASVIAFPGAQLANVRALVAGGGNTTEAPAAPLYFGHTCAVLASGEAVCWGANGHGQLGGGTTGGSTDGTGVTPLSAAATTLTNIASLSAGERFTCALKTDRSTVCWGQNGFGQFGDDTTTDSAYATPAFGLGGAVSLVAGAQHACVLRWGGNVECSGKGTAGQLGDNSTLSSDLPVGVLTQADAVFGAQWQRCEAITVSTP